MKYLQETFKLPPRVFIIIFSAFVLRVLWLNEKLFFGFEQGRDLIAVREIIFNHSLKLIGPNTDIQGIYHGALSYYLLIPYYLLSFGNPVVLTSLLIFTNCVAIIFLYKALVQLFDRKIALYSILIYSVSYSAIVYSRWLSNPNLIPAITILIFYFLVLSRDKSKYLIPAGFLWAILFHLSLATAGTLVIPILVFIFSFRIRLSLTTIFLTGLSILLVLSTYLVFDLRHGFLLSQNLVHYLGSGALKSANKVNLDVFSNEVVSTLFPSGRVAGLTFFLVILACLLSKLRDRKYLVILSFLITPPLLFFLLGINPLRHIFIITPIFLSIATALSFERLQRFKINYWAWFLVIGIILGNLWEILYSLPKSQNNFLQQEQRTYLGDEEKIIDYIYTDAKGNQFSYDYYTIPYWQRQGWQYLFDWYGKGKYGYLPQEDRTDTFYVVMEEDFKQPVFQKNWHNSLNDHSTIVSSFVSGKLTVEKRVQK